MIRNHRSELLSDNWYILRKHTYEFRQQNGEWVEQVREAYDRGNGAAILLYNKAQATVLLTRQFRLPTFLNGNPDGMMIEACAGLLDEADPAECVRRETEEETGYRIQEVEKVMEAYMSPGAVTEILYLFVGEYEAHQKVSEGGGLAEETEDIEVLEYSLDQALAMVKSGEIKDAKTIMLLQYAKLNGVVQGEGIFISRDNFRDFVKKNFPQLSGKPLWYKLLKKKCRIPEKPNFSEQTKENEKEKPNCFISTGNCHRGPWGIDCCFSK